MGTCRTDISDQFRKLIIRHKRIGHNLKVMRQSACLMINPIKVDNFAALFNWTPMDRMSDSISSVAWSSDAQLLIFFCFRFPVVVFGSLQLSCNTLYLLSTHLCFFVLLKRDLFVYRDHSLTS